jgi:exonuclease VII small subunit
MSEVIGNSEAELKDWFWSKLDSQRIYLENAITELQTGRPDIDWSDLQKIVATLKEQTLQLENKVKEL